MAWSSFARPLEMLTQDIAYLYGDAQALYEACAVLSFRLISLIDLGFRRCRADKRGG